MSDIVQVGHYRDGRPVYGPAPLPAPMTVPSGFVLDMPHVKCTRDGCDWRRDVDSGPLTEVVGVALGHIQEAHRG